MLLLVGICHGGGLWAAQRRAATEGGHVTAESGRGGGASVVWAKAPRGSCRGSGCGLGLPGGASTRCRNSLARYRTGSWRVVLGAVLGACLGLARVEISVGRVKRDVETWRGWWQRQPYAEQVQLGAWCGACAVLLLCCCAVLCLVLGARWLVLGRWVAMSSVQ